jgi:hypothetical protein
MKNNATPIKTERIGTKITATRAPAVSSLTSLLQIMNLFKIPAIGLNYATAIICTWLGRIEIDFADGAIISFIVWMIVNIFFQVLLVV